jgi:hypothetical protein
MSLWLEWFRCVQALRPACARARTFMWMCLALFGLCIRSDLGGVTSFVRAGGLAAATYHRLLHLFHTPALALDTLTTLWVRLVLKLFVPLRAGTRPVLVADGLKAPKEGRLMPAVKKLHQESTDNSKPEFIFGHSFQAVGLLVRGPLGQVFSVPLASRIHEGLVFCNADRRTLLDKLVQLFLSISKVLEGPSLLVADAYYASRKVILPLLEKGHHLVTRVRTTTVAYRLAHQPKTRGPGRPRLYGTKVRLRNVWKQKHRFSAAASPVYGEKAVKIRYHSVDLLWRPVGRLVRFVFVDHPHRGRLILMTSDTSLDALEVIATYGHRFKIEVGFKQALHTLGSYAYHFWMMDMKPFARKSGNQHVHKESEEYRRLVRRKMDAYHRYVQLSAVAQGLLQHLSLNFRKSVWGYFGSWMRTMKPSAPPSEAVVVKSLRSALPEFLAAADDDHELKKSIAEHADFDRFAVLQLTG